MVYQNQKKSKISVAAKKVNQYTRSTLFDNEKNHALGKLQFKVSTSSLTAARLTTVYNGVTTYYQCYQISFADRYI
jgi:outer membrane protein TolC